MTILSTLASLILWTVSALLILAARAATVDALRMRHRCADYTREGLLVAAGALVVSLAMARGGWATWP